MAVCHSHRSGAGPEFLRLIGFRTSCCVNPDCQNDEGRQWIARRYRYPVALRFSRPTDQPTKRRYRSDPCFPNHEHLQRVPDRSGPKIPNRCVRGRSLVVRYRAFQLIYRLMNLSTRHWPSNATHPRQTCFVQTRNGHHRRHCEPPGRSRRMVCGRTVFWQQVYHRLIGRVSVFHRGFVVGYRPPCGVAPWVRKIGGVN